MIALFLAAAWQGGDFNPLPRIVYRDDHVKLKELAEQESPALRDSRLLFLAACAGSNECLRILLNAVDPTLRDSNGETVAHYAAIGGNDKGLEIIKAGWPQLLYVGNRHGWLPVHIAAAVGRKEAIRVAAADGLISARTQFGQTPAHVAMLTGNATAIDFFLPLHADSYGVDALGLDVEHYGSEVVTFERRIPILPADDAELLVYVDNLSSSPFRPPGVVFAMWSDGVVISRKERGGVFELVGGLLPIDSGLVARWLAECIAGSVDLVGGHEVSKVGVQTDRGQWSQLSVSISSVEADSMFKLNPMAHRSLLFYAILQRRLDWIAERLAVSVSGQELSQVVRDRDFGQSVGLSPK